jgi:hypothetical protein
MQTQDDLYKLAKIIQIQRDNEAWSHEIVMMEIYIVAFIAILLILWAFYRQLRTMNATLKVHTRLLASIANRTAEEEPQETR